jgi:hypothetical protein
MKLFFFIPFTFALLVMAGPIQKQLLEEVSSYDYCCPILCAWSSDCPGNCGSVLLFGATCCNKSAYICRGKGRKQKQRQMTIQPISFLYERPTEGAVEDHIEEDLIEAE